MRVMRKTGLSMAVTMALVIAAGSCTQETKVDISRSLNPAGMPSMVTHNISTLISDSGVTQYKIVAPVWYVYDEVDTPYWLFPKGLYLQKYDPKFNVVATVAADSARFFKMQKLWRLEGNVEMTKAPKDLFPFRAGVLGPAARTPLFRHLHTYRERDPYIGGHRF